MQTSTPCLTRLSGQPKLRSSTRPRLHVFLVADLYADLGIGGSAWQIRYAQAYRTKEFEGQAERQVFGSISVSFFR